MEEKKKQLIAPKPMMNGDKPIKVVQNPTYRMGRIGCFIHKEGNENPIDLKEIKATGNPQFNRLIEQRDYTLLWFQQKNFADNWILWVIGGIVVIGVIITVVYLISRGQKPV